MNKIDIEADAVDVAAVDEADKIEAVRLELLTIEEKVDPADDETETIRKPIASDLGQGFSAYPVDRNGNRVDWHDVKARAGGGVVTVHEHDEITPDPAATIKNPLPPLKIEPKIAVLTAYCPGADQEKIEAAVAAKAEAATVAATAKLTAAKEAPKEIGVGELGAAELKP